MNTGQGLLCLAVGAGALIGGVAMSLPAAPALGASALAIAVSGQSLSAIGGALAGNVTQSGLQKSYSAVAKRLMAGREAARLPQNHDLIRSLRLSQLDAIKYISESFHQEIAKDTLHPDGEYQHSSRTEFRNTINSYVRAEIKRYSNRKLDFDDQWLATLGKENQEIEEKLQPADQFSVASSLEWLAGTASKAALDEIVGALGKNKIALNDDFRDWYQGRFGSTGFAYAAHQFFAERMKTDERLRTAVFSMSFETIEHQGRHALEILSRLDCKLDGMDNSLSSRFDALEEQIKMLAPSN
ncbi:MAG TPA: hypothetical protein PLS83_12395, partial [Methanothrix soehngenii]|nr:hypothetical protein [Methanothrix soehngenii]